MAFPERAQNGHLSRGWWKRRNWVMEEDGTRLEEVRAFQRRKGQVRQDLLAAGCRACSETSMKPAGVSAMLLGAMLKMKASSNP